VTTALATTQGSNLAVSSMQIGWREFLESAMASGAYKDVQNVNQAVMKMVYGRALGIDEATALASIYIVQGKPTISANLMAARLNTSGKYYYEVLEKTDKKCSIQFYKQIEDYTDKGVQFKRWIKPGPPETYTIEMATKAGLTKNETWQKHPTNMCFCRAMSNGVKTYCPELLTGIPIYTPDELDPSIKLRVLDDGEVVPDAEYVEAPKTASKPATKTNNLATAKKLLEETATDQTVFMRAQFGKETLEQLTQSELETAVQMLRLKQNAPKMATVS